MTPSQKSCKKPQLSIINPHKILENFSKNPLKTIKQLSIKLKKSTKHQKIRKNLLDFAI
jgi:hypothetical protein